MNPIVVSEPLGENVRVDRVYKDCPIVVCGRTMCAYLVELPMNYFDIILGKDWLHSFYTCMDIRCRVVRFCFPNERELGCEGYNLSCLNPFISNIKANKIMSERLFCHLLSVNDLDHDIPSIDSVPIVNEFQDVFLDDLPRVPPP